MSGRHVTENIVRFSRKHLAVLQEENAAFPWDEYPRPRTRGDCLEGGSNAQRPCPFVSCKYHLAIDVQFTGNITENFPGRDIDELPETCALDLADRGGVVLDEVGTAMNVTRERIRQIEAHALRRLARRPGAQELLPLLAGELLDESQAAIARGAVPVTRAPVASISDQPANDDPDLTDDEALQRWLARRHAKRSTTAAAGFIPRADDGGGRATEETEAGGHDGDGVVEPASVDRGPEDSPMPSCEWKEDTCTEEQSGRGQYAHLCKRHRNTQYQRDVAARKRGETPNAPAKAAPASSTTGSIRIRVAAFEIEGEDVSLEQLVELWSTVRRVSR